MSIHPATVLGAALVVLSFNDTLVHGLGEMTAMQDRLLRPLVGVLMLVLPGMVLLAYGAFARTRRPAPRDEPRSEGG